MFEGWRFSEIIARFPVQSTQVKVPWMQPGIPWWEPKKFPASRENPCRINFYLNFKKKAVSPIDAAIIQSK